VRSFELVTGEKTDNLPTRLEADHWLLMTVSVLITTISITLLVAAVRRGETFEVGLMAVLAAIGLTSIDAIYVFRRVISPVYLIDAAVEVPLIAAWLYELTVESSNAIAAPASREHGSGQAGSFSGAAEIR